ncbi:TPA: hypothetical protein O8U20_004057 [Enterobacter cloacae]|nr:hypothetical protein [Enterobacter cloacae]
MLSVLGNKYFVALVFPLMMILCGGVIKKLARSSFWQKSDFYFGGELILAAMGAALLNLYDLTSLVKSPMLPAEMVNKYLWTTSFIIICFVTLLLVVSVHQDLEKRTGSPRLQFWVLGPLFNFIGVFLFAAFVMWIKGV